MKRIIYSYDGTTHHLIDDGYNFVRWYYSSAEAVRDGLTHDDTMFVDLDFKDSMISTDTVDYETYIWWRKCAVTYDVMGHFTIGIDRPAHSLHCQDTLFWRIRTASENNLASMKHLMEG